MCVKMSSDLGFLRRRRYIRVLKPLLARKRSSSARINLNRHWNELEEAYSRPHQHHHPALDFDSLLLHNELNDNAINEAREAAASSARTTRTAKANILPAATTAATKGANAVDLPGLPTTYHGASTTLDFTILGGESAVAATTAPNTILAAATTDANAVELLTPPATPSRPPSSTTTTSTVLDFFGVFAMEEEEEEETWPLTPSSPQPWDAFTFPCLTLDTPKTTDGRQATELS